MSTQMQTINGRLPNGVEFSFEIKQGASKEEIQKAAKAKIDSLGIQAPAKTEESKPAPVQPRKVDTGSISAAPKNYTTYLTNAARAIFPEANQPFIESLIEKLPRNLREALPYVRTGASATTGAAVGLGLTASGVGAPAAGLASSATMAYMDQLLRKFTGEKTGSPLLQTQNPLLAGAEQTVLNEAGGRAMGFIGRGLFGESGLSSELSNLKPTTAQGTQSKVAKFVEDTFALGKKEAGKVESAGLAVERNKEIVSQLTGRTKPSNEHLAEVMTAEVRNAYRQSMKASSESADKFFLAAENNTIRVPQPPQVVPSSMVDEFGQVVTHEVPQPDLIIQGPVYFKNTVDKLLDFKNEISLSKLKPDVEQPVVKGIQDILEGVGYDPKTGSFSPISAAEAWKTKQMADRLGFGDLIQNQGIADFRFQDISKTINKDIEESVKGWGNPEALKFWKDAKAIVQQRHEVFTPLGEVGKSTKTLLSTVNKADPVIDHILDDHLALQRFLDTGSLKMNGRTITATNARKDMQGYALQRIFNRNFTPIDPLNPSAGTLNGAKMLTDWTEFATSKSGQKLLSSQQIKNYTEFLQAVKAISENPSSSSRWIAVNVGAKGISLAGALMAQRYGAGTLGQASVVGATFGLAGLARLMTSKKWAPVFLAFLKNKPLGMSFQAAARGVVQTLSGTRMTVRTEDGTQIEGTIDTQGNFVPSR